MYFGARGSAIAEMYRSPTGSARFVGESFVDRGVVRSLACRVSLETTYDTSPLEEDLYVNGPIQADLWVSTTSNDASLVVRVADVGPDGTPFPLTHGIMQASLRAVDESKSRTLDGEMIQPWYPFTQKSVDPPGSGNVVLVPIEIFPTAALIKKGHRLRISVGASDFPHGLPPLPSFLNQLPGVLTIHSDAEHPSSIVLPVVSAGSLG